jgi:hypothetical protein
MSEVHSPSTGRRYSIKRVCAVWQIPRSTTHSQLRRSSLTDLPVPRKRGPVGAATDEELVSLIRQVIDASPFHGEGYRKIWARLPRCADIKGSNPSVDARKWTPSASRTTS